MKHIALSLLAAACGALSASALDASNARIWLDEKIQPEFANIGSGISSEKFGSAPAYARGWQYLSIPVHVEGVAKGDSQPHYIPELKVRISLAIATMDEKGKVTDSPELLSKEITYVDIPLSKGKKPNMGEGVVNVGVFVSPANAFKLSAKDGGLTKKLIAVAVEGTFEGSSCNRVKEKPNDSVATGVVIDKKVGRNLAAGWWTKKGAASAALSAISETPFAHEYARLGFPATNPLYGPAGAPVPAAPAATPGAAGPASGAEVAPAADAPSGPAYDPRAAEAAAREAAAGDADESSEGKKGKKSKKSRR